MRFLLPLCLLATACAEGTAPTGGSGGSGAAGGSTVSAADGGGGTGGHADGAGASGGQTSDGAGTPDGGAGSSQGAGGTGGELGHGGEGPIGLEQSCPANQFATGFDASGVIQCSPVDASVSPAVNAGCEVYLGIRDGCGSCSTAPSKWGKASGTTCTLGLGVNDTCQDVTISGDTVRMFGLNTDGDVDENDKLYGGFQCDPGVPAQGAGPCDAGEMVVGYDNGQVSCASAGAVALDYVRQSCKMYFGWKDECNACPDAPAKWGTAGSLACNAGVGSGNTCVTTTLGADQVPLLGIDLDGDVDGNDKIHVGMVCQAALPAGGPQPSACPAGQFVVGTHDDGAVECASPGPEIDAYVSAHCSVYLGWRDEVDGSALIPTKYGHARDGFCVNDLGTDNTCNVVNLGGEAVSLFGLGTDGDVNDDDKLYIGFLCD